jgi:ABC-type transport system substrate-binding protein
MKSRVRLIYSIAAVVLLSLSGVLAISPTHPSSAASAASCTSSNTFRLTLYPAPTSFNFLGAFSTSNVELEGAMWFPIDPAYNNNGSPFTNFSTTDVITHNANYTVWQFHVMPGLKWSDGTPVTANDILATFGPNFSLNAAYDLLNLHQEITKEFAVNSSTAEFDLNTTNAYLPTDFDIDNNHVYPASMIQQYGVHSNFLTNPIVDGPFVPTGYTQGASQMVMVPNQYFQGKTAVCQIDVSFTEVEGLDASLVQSGSTDLAEITYATASSLTSNPNIHILQEPTHYMQDLQYNVTQYPMNITSFRQAIEYGINDSAIIQTAFNGYAVAGYSAQGSVPPTIKSIYSSNQMNYSFNPTKAISLLNSIGLTGGTGGAPLRYANGSQVTLTLISDTSKSFDVTSAQVIVSNLESLGFKVNLVTMSEGAEFGLPSVGAATIVLFTTGGPIFPNVLFDMEPGWDVYSPVTIPQNYWEWPPSVNTQYNNNLTALEATTNPTLVAQYSANIQSINAQYLPSIITCYPDDLWAYSTANWVNWTPSSSPSGWVNGNAEFNPFEIYTLIPASQATSTQTSSVSSHSSSVTTSSGSTPPSTSAVSTSTSSTTSAPGSSPTLTIAAIAVVVIVIIAALAVVLMRRRGPATGTPT